MNREEKQIDRKGKMKKTGCTSFTLIAPRVFSPQPEIEMGAK
jgi:hypothetical protein